jgi:hypothetical protein
MTMMMMIPKSDQEHTKTLSLIAIFTNHSCCSHTYSPLTQNYTASKSGQIKIKTF